MLLLLRVTAVATLALGSLFAQINPDVLRQIDRVQDDDIYVRRSAAQALGGIGPDAVDPLIATLQDVDRGGRLSAAGALGHIGPDAKDAVAPLIAALQEGDYYVRSFAADALGRIAKGLQDDRAVDAISPLRRAQRMLVEVGEDEMAEEVRRAADALGAYKQNEFSERFLAFVHRAKPYPWILPGLLLSIAYLAWFLILQFGVLPRKPLTLLRWNESLASVDYKLPGWAGEATVPFRKVALIGFYHYHPHVLEAWVKSHAPHARTKLEDIETVRQRKTYVPLPVRLEGKTVTELTPQLLQPTCDQKRWCVFLRGEGGLGKTTLALQVTRWALAEESSNRLCRDRQMLPVLLEPGIGFDVREKLDVFKNEIRGSLGLLVGAEEEIPEGLFEKLLSDRRLLVILDGLSEMPGLADSPDAARPQNPGFSVNALLVTSRHDEKLNPDTTIEPQRIDANHLLPFINAYLSEAGHQELTDSELFEASRRLADLVTMETGITPLLARLFAQQLVDLQSRGEATDRLPRNVPELMLAYLNSLNRQRGEEDPEDPDVHRAAKIAA